MPKKIKVPEPINELHLLGKWTSPMYPIVFAYLEHDVAMLQRFINAGADINIDIGGWTLLHRICANAIDAYIQNEREDFYPDHLEMIKTLLANGADINKPDHEGKKPLDVILDYSYNNLEAFELYIKLFKPAIPNINELITFSWDL